MQKSSHKTAATNPFLALTWTDLEEWAGAKILSRGKSYQRSGQVQKLGITLENELVAWVQGTSRYATQVRCQDGELSSSCTCPYGSDCKHAVAIVIDYLQAVKKGKTIAQVPQDDERLQLIRKGVTVWPDGDEEEEWEDETDEEDEEGEDEEPDEKISPRPADLNAFLKERSKAELCKMLSEVVKNHPEIELEILSTPKIPPPSTERLAQMIRKKDRQDKPRTGLVQPLVR